MQTDNPRSVFDGRPDSHSRRSLPDGTAILLLCIPVALGLGMLIGHAFPAEWMSLLQK